MKNISGWQEEMKKPGFYPGLFFLVN